MRYIVVIKRDSSTTQGLGEATEAIQAAVSDSKVKVVSRRAGILVVDTGDAEAPDKLQGLLCVESVEDNTARGIS